MITKQIQKLYGARNSLRVKLFSGFIGLSLILSITLGFTLYKVSNAIYYKSFLLHKRSLGISLANGIAGEVFETFTNPNSLELPEFKRYLNYMRSVSKNEDHITWIYSVILDRKTDKLIYAIDATPIPDDTILIENEYLGLRVYINQNGKLSVFLDSEEHTSDFTINYRNKTFDIEFESNNDYLKINNVTILKILSRYPFVAETDS